MDMEQVWAEWITQYRDRRAPTTPIGYYNLADLRAAFDAGAHGFYEYGMKAIDAKIRAALDGKIKGASPP